MKIQIARIPGDIIAVSTDLRDIQHRGELSHILAELETLKVKLLRLWNEFEDKT